MLDLMELEKGFLRKHIKKGGTVIDFTMGNGHDTACLSKEVGEEGHVYAFDIQAKALVSRLELGAKEQEKSFGDDRNVLNYIVVIGVQLLIY